MTSTGKLRRIEGYEGGGPVCGFGPMKIHLSPERRETESVTSIGEEGT